MPGRIVHIMHWLALLALASCASPLPATSLPATPQPARASATIATATAPPEHALTTMTVSASHAPAQTPGPAPVATLGLTSRGRVENFVLIGHNALDGRGWHAGLALVYPCAYVGNRRLPQVAIVDVSDPTQPVRAGELPIPPGSQPIELRAVPDMGLLVVLNFSPSATIVVYDVRDCRNPQAVGAFDLGAVPHEFFLWRDPARPTRLLLYAAMFYHRQPDLEVVDLSEPAAPRRVTTWTAAGDGAEGTLHSLSLSPDGRRAYLALWEGGFLVADTSALAEGRAEARIRLVRDAAGELAPAPGLSVHSAVRLSDPRYVLLTQEVYTCPFAGLFIAELADETHPRLVGRFDLPENDGTCDKLPQSDAVFTAHNPLVVGNLAFVTWYGGGLQALDVSNPLEPRRVGLFVPSGDGAAPQSYVGTYPVQMWSYPILREGLIYVADIQSGLYVLAYTGPGAEAVRQVPLAEGNVTVLP